MTDQALIQMAKQAATRAYAPYSEFQVGAALEARNGQVFCGCNVENASYGAAICAERTAISKAISEGVRDFDRIAVVSTSGQCAYPCGICLQVLSEFMPDGSVLLEEAGALKSYTVKELLPAAFVLLHGKENTHDATTKPPQ